MSNSAQILARVLRSGLEESIHHGHIVAADVHGTVVRAIGDPSYKTFLRSSAKPFQAVATLELGAGVAFSWSDEELALVCASHSAETVHQDHVRSILAKADLAESDLLCGPHAPVDADERRRLAVQGIKPSKIHNNCSGKHAGMLATCVANSWPTATYLEPNHPLQKHNLATIARFAGVRESNVSVGVDGCGVPSFWMSMQAAATAFARLANPQSSRDALTDDDVYAAERVARAMSNQPRLIGGTGRFNSQLVEFVGPRLVAKSGAEGFFGVGLAGLGLGISIKISDGSARAHPAVLCRLLADYLPDLDWRNFLTSIDAPITNTLGQVVGFVESTF